ncbi:MAG: DNA polymerase III subunit delta [Firmicutes bacterium]|nr:DNA polymerase III subunit delta [Bacillota bacterium]
MMAVKPKEAPGGAAVLKQCKSDLESGALAGAVLLFGRERYLVKNAENAIATRFVNPAVKELDLTRIEADAFSVNGLVEQCETLPVFSEKRVVIVRDLPQLEGKTPKGFTEENETELLAYVKNVPETTVLVFVSKSVDKRAKLFKAIPNAYEFGPVERNVLEKFAARTLAPYGKTIAPAAFRLLVERTGYYPDAFRKTAQREYDYTLYHLENDLAKLAGGTEAAEIGEADVEELVGGNLETDVFRILDAAFEGRTGESLAQLRNLLRSGESVFKILGLLVSQLEIMTVAKEMQEDRKPLPAMVEALGVHEYRIKKSLPLVRSRSAAQLEETFRFALEIDRSIKTGALEGPVALELLIARI